MPHKNWLSRGHAPSPEDEGRVFDVSVEQIQGDLFIGSDSPVKQQVQDILSWGEISQKVEHISESSREVIAEACAKICVVGARKMEIPDAPDTRSEWHREANRRVIHALEDHTVERIHQEEMLLTEAISKIIHCALTVIEEHPDRYYKRFDIPKWNGKTRTIESPNGPKAFLMLDESTKLEDAYLAFNKLSALRREAFSAIEYDISNWADRDWDFIPRHDPYLKLYSTLASVFRIPSEPINIVAAAQKLTLCSLNNRWLSDSVCGFRPGSGAYDGLRRALDGLYRLGHKKIGSMYQIDIRNFFPSIDHGMAKDGLLHSLMYSGNTTHLPRATLDQAANGIARIASIDSRLTQGSHTSPMLANLYAQYAFDAKILKLIRTYSRAAATWRKHNNKTTTQLEYARYADDIVIFSSHTIPETLRMEIDAIIEESGLKIAPEKRSYLTNKRAYTVWGAHIPSEIGGWTFTPPRYDNPKNTVENYRFMPPKKVQENICRYTFETLKWLKERNIESWGDLQYQPEFQKMVGYYSHAHHVGNPGYIRTLGKKTNQYYCFTGELVHAWEAVLTQYRDILPEHFQKNIFVVGRD